MSPAPRWRAVTSIEHIQALIDELVALAPWWAGWARMIDDTALEAFELDHGVELWAPHRAVLERIGDRAPLPTHVGGALVPLADARAMVAVDELLGPLAAPFPHVGGAAVEVAWDDARDEFVEPRWLPGCLPLASGGCDLTVVLVVSGPDRGRVWKVTPGAAPQLHPTGLEFASWYARELESGLEPHRRRAAREAELDARLARDPADRSAAIELGAALVHRAPERAAPLLERAWLERAASPASVEPSLARAIAEHDLAAGRHDRLATLAGHDDVRVRAYAAIAAIRSGQPARGLALLDGLEIPATLRALVAEHEALARARSGDLDGALASLRRAPPDRRIVELRAAVLDARGDGERAARERARLRGPATTKPQAPTLRDRLAPLELGSIRRPQ